MMEEGEVSILDVAFGGKGVGRIDGMVCFTKGVIDGEKVRVRVRKKRKQFLEADLLEVLKPSPHRQESPCPYFLKCGGCAYQHIDYAHQVQIKEKQLRDALQRIAGIPQPPVATIIPSPEPFHYRNRITVHVRDGEVGFFREQEKVIVPIDACLLASQEVNQALSKLRAARVRDGDYLLAEKKRYGGFRQVNNSVAGLLLEEVCREAGEGASLIDAYCGAGFFAHALASRFQKVIGIERSEGSVALARKEASPHEEFLEGSVEEMLPQALVTVSEGPCTLILDPPSEGVSQLVVQAILQAPPTKLIYVSCNPATLARDIKRLSSSYHLTKSVPLDMFPQTAEIESVNVLSCIVE
ncbi:MAG: TRAM domain-containing protein [Chthoniobacterales bacterium]|nr:TRAM domain-containing protein [Chthoniobacterales bacterium]